MRPFNLLAAAVLFPLCLGAETNSTNAASKTLSQLPDCAVPCITSALSNSTCDLTDLECLCSDKPFNDAATACVRATCSRSDALLADNTTHVACGAPLRDRSGQFNKTLIPLGVITIVITLARLFSKLYFSSGARSRLSTSFFSGLEPDDWCIVATLAICVAGLVIAVRGMAASGLGRDAWTLTTGQTSRVALWFYVMEMLYFAGMALVKLSFSLFFLRLFAGAVVVPLLWATAVFNALWGVVFIITAVFQCSPVSYYWTQYLDGSRGSCVDINLFGWINAGIGVAIDVWMLALPLSQIWPLQLHWKKKIAVTIMFLLGTFVTIVSILRLHSLIHFAKSSNPTWDQWETAYWSVIEVNVGVICSCLPSIRLLLVRLYPKVFGTNTVHQPSLQLDSYRRGDWTKDFRLVEEQNSLAEQRTASSYRA